MQILTRKLFETGCQFQLVCAHDKYPLYITEYNSEGHFVLIEYKYACEYGRIMWSHIYGVIFIDPKYFIFNCRIFGELETVTRYYNQFKIVNYKKHEY